MEPADPATWIWSTTAVIGGTSDGTLSVNGGSVLTSQLGSLGVQSGVTGTVTVDGTGSAWSNGNQLYVGWSGVAAMNIINGGTMSSGSSYVGCGAGQLTVPGSGSTGTVTVSCAWADVEQP